MQIQQLVPGFNLAPYSTHLPAEAYQTLLLARLQKIKQQAEHVFIHNNFGKIYAEAANKGMAMQDFMNIWHQWLTFYFPTNKEALAESFWAYSNVATLQQRVTSLDERAKKAAKVMRLYVQALALECEEKRNDVDSGIVWETISQIRALLAQSEFGVPFVQIPAESRQLLDEIVKKKYNIPNEGTLTYDQRKEGYAWALLKLANRVPVNAIDSNSKKNTLGLLASQYKNAEIFKLIKKAPNNGLDRKNCYGVSAQSYNVACQQLPKLPRHAPSTKELLLPEEVFNLETILSHYLEDWFIKDEVMKSRKLAASQGAIVAKSFESLYAFVDKLFNTRGQFNDRAEQVKNCLLVINQNRFKFDGNSYKEKLNEILQDISPGALGSLGNYFGVGSATYRTLSNAARSMSNLPLTIMTPQKEEQVMSLASVAGNADLELVAEDKNELLQQSEEKFESYKIASETKHAATEAKLTMAEQKLTTTEEALTATQAELAAYKSETDAKFELMFQMFAERRESNAAVSAPSVGTHGATMFSGRQNSRASSSVNILVESPASTAGIESKEEQGDAHIQSLAHSRHPSNL